MNARAARMLSGCRNALAAPAAPMTLNVIAVVAIAWVAAALTWPLTWQLLPTPTAAPDTTILPAAPTATVDGSASTDIGSLHLFGEARTATRTQPQATPADAPETRLNLELTGVFAAGGGDGIAIIVAGNAPQSVFAVGDRVAGQARVDGIYADRVMLERNGALETLRLSEDSVSTSSATGDAARGNGNREIQRIARKARDLRARLIRNPLELARMVRFQPYLRDGELVGYRIQPRAADARLLAELGLQPTDVVTEVNGVPLNDPAKAQQVLQKMQSASTISVTWLRNGEQHRMSVPIGQAQ